LITSTKNLKLAFITGNRQKDYQLGIVVPHRPLYDFLSFLCWYSFAVNYEILNAHLFFIGRPDNHFRSWAQKFNFKITFIDKFENLTEIDRLYGNKMKKPYIFCMYNVFLIKEDKSMFEKSFYNSNIIFKTKEQSDVYPFQMNDCSHNDLIPIVKFNFADEDLILISIVNTNNAGNPFLAEKKALDESANEIRLNALYRRSREIYRLLMEGYNEQQI
jgi:hypothetical protein